MSFATIPIITDREQALAAFVEKMQVAFPGWEAAEGDLLLWFAEWVADEYPDLAGLAAEMSSLAFSNFGETVLGVPPIPAASATATTTWTLTDTAGHTIPEGTQVQIADGDDLFAFTVTQDVSVPNGSVATAAGGVTIRAIIAGEAANDLTADPTLIDALPFVDSITLVTDTSGGTEAEDPDDFLDRLKDEFKLLSKVLILPADVATAARRVAGVARATVIDGYYPGVNEVQRLSFTGTPSSGTSTLTYAGQTTTGVTITETATALQARLEALSNIAPGDVVVTGGPLPAPIDVEFTGTLAKTNVAQMTVTDSMTGGDLVVATVTAGAAATSNNEKTVAVYAIDDAGANVSSLVKAAIAAELDARREVGFLFYVGDASRTQVKVSVTVVAWPGVDATGLQTSISGVLTDYLSAANWGLDPLDSDPGIWLNETVVRRLELVSLVDRVEGVKYVSSLTLAEQSGVLGTSDVTLSGPAPLPTPGTFVITVT